VDAALDRVETGETTIEDANLLRAVMDRLRGTVKAYEQYDGLIATHAWAGAERK
jgi:hypothetical protein